MLKFHRIAVVGDGPRVILMFVERRIEKPWKMIIQSYASKEGIRGCKYPKPLQGSCHGDVEKLWREFFSDPSQWWDHRSEKANVRYPDFKHMKTQKAPLAQPQEQKALELYRQMQVECVKPEPVTFVGVLNACASAGWLEEGRRIHEQIIKRETTGVHMD
ncbi:unnamed protein product [Sphagnum balticum]